MTSLSSLTVNYFVTLLNLHVLVLAIADVCHRRQYCEQVVEGLERTKCFERDSCRNLLTFRPSSPLVPHLTTR
jgi:hypothetical protein